MCKLIKRIICLPVIALIVFLAVAMWSGGEKFRWLGRKTGGIVERTTEKLGSKADEIKGKKDAAAGLIKKLTDYKGGGNEASDGKLPEKTPKREQERGETGDDETAAASERGQLKNIIEKLKALIKG